MTVACTGEVLHCGTAVDSFALDDSYYWGVPLAVAANLLHWGVVPVGFAGVEHSSQRLLLAVAEVVGVVQLD